MVSLIIPYYNRQEVIAETLNSIINQTYKEWEALFIDDGSEDNTTAIVESFAQNDDRIFIHKRHRLPKGPGTCRNIGVEKARGKYLIFLDSDDIIANTCLEKRTEYMRLHPDLDFTVFPQQVFKNKPGDLLILFTKCFDKLDEYLRSFIRDEHPWQTSGPIWRKESFIAIGGFNEDYLVMEDPELHIRALIQNYKFNFISSSPDFFYRLPERNQIQEEAFWSSSITYRIKFFKELDSLLVRYHQFERYKRDLTQGYLNFMKIFLLGRIEHSYLEYNEITKWERSKNLVNLRQRIVIQLYGFVSRNEFLKRFRIRGILYKFI